MVKKIDTQECEFEKLSSQENEWVYNALDCCVTSEVWEEMSKSVENFTWPSYHFVKGMQGPALHMAVRGIRIDMQKRGELIATLERTADRLQNHLNLLADAVWGGELNPQSPKQLIEFFYTCMNIPAQTKWDGKRKERVVTTDRDALEKIRDMYYYARPIAKHILAIRDLRKQASTLRTGVDEDCRMRTSYNVAGTETARWSSNENAFGTGTNFQNWADKLREIFISDINFKMGYFDGEQAESRLTAYVSGDQEYINACESGDLHTSVTRMVWPELEWTGDATLDRQIAERKFYREFSYRDMSKKLGHGSNYYGKPPTLAKHAHIEVKMAEEFQDRYFSAFPGIRNWHTNTAYELQTTGKLTTPLGRTRYFLGRLWDDSTLREAIAFVPQSSVAEIINEGIYRVWEELEIKQKLVQVLAQVHDAGLYQWKDEGDEYEKHIIALIKKTMTVSVPINGRILTIPISCEGTGWNWRKRSVDKLGRVTNDQGLKKFTGHEQRTRKAINPNPSVLGQLYI